MPAHLPADGVSTARLAASAPGGAAVPSVRFEIVEGARLARLEGGVLRAGVLPGHVRVRAAAPGYLPAEGAAEFTPYPADSLGDGTPDALRLDDPADRAAFRRWFTFLAELQAWRGRALPAEINDCAALIRFAYREALRPHDSSWASSLPLVPAMPAVRKYQYPYTPLGAGLFRTGPGPYRPGDKFAEFADAENLCRWNARRMGRQLSLAEPGDLLFFFQERQKMPYHAMIFVGRSHFDPAPLRGSQVSRSTERDQAPAEWVVYHTGPIGQLPGEIRRVKTSDLLRHPVPEWRPVAGNLNFLGVYRWNILREVE